jgi:hypothetical protein
MGEPTDRSSGGGRAPRGAVRARMVEGAVRLLATRGVEGTSFAEVLEATVSPRVSPIAVSDRSLARSIAAWINSRFPPGKW